MNHIDKPWDNTPPSKGGLKPPPYAGSGPDCDCTPPPPPPPVAPAHWIPGANWQEQMNHVMERTNEAICRWNQISADCYKALHDTVDAAISNDVYYDRDEVNLYCGYDEAEESTYYVISARAVDKRASPFGFGWLLHLTTPQTQGLLRKFLMYPTSQTLMQLLPL